MSQSNSDDETLMQVKQSTPSRVRFADEAGPSSAQIVPATPITPTTDTTTVTSRSVDRIWTPSISLYQRSSPVHWWLVIHLRMPSWKRYEIASWRRTRTDASRYHPIYNLSGKTYKLRMDVSALTTEYPFLMQLKTHTWTPSTLIILEHCEWPIWQLTRGGHICIYSYKNCKMQPLCQDW